MTDTKSPHPNFTNFYAAAYKALREPMNAMLKHPLSRILSRREIGTALATANLRAAALSIYGAEIDPKEFDGLLAQFVAQIALERESRQQPYLRRKQ